MTAHRADPDTPHAAAVGLLVAVVERAQLDAGGQMESDIRPIRRPVVAAAAADWLQWARRELIALTDPPEAASLSAGRRFA